MCRNRATMPVPITAPRNASATPSPSVCSCHCFIPKLRPFRRRRRVTTYGPVSTPRLTPGLADTSMVGGRPRRRGDQALSGYPVRDDAADARRAALLPPTEPPIPTRLLDSSPSRLVKGAHHGPGYHPWIPAHRQAARAEAGAGRLLVRQAHGRRAGGDGVRHPPRQLGRPDRCRARSRPGQRLLPLRPRARYLRAGRRHSSPLRLDGRARSTSISSSPWRVAARATSRRGPWS